MNKQITNEAGIIEPNDDFHIRNRHIQAGWDAIYAQMNGLSEYAKYEHLLKPHSDSQYATLDMFNKGSYHTMPGIFSGGIKKMDISPEEVEMLLNAEWDNFPIIGAQI